MNTRGPDLQGGAHWERTPGGVHVLIALDEYDGVERTFGYIQRVRSRWVTNHPGGFEVIKTRTLAKAREVLEWRWRRYLVERVKEELAEEDVATWRRTIIR